MRKLVKTSLLLSTAIGVGLALPSGAWAQAAPASQSSSSAPSSNDIEEVVVTGTLIRNVIPAGALPITIDAAAIQATGATSTDQLLATVPQLSSFGTLNAVDNHGIQLTVVRTNLRNLPQGIGGSSPTLVLVDGHRIVSEGIQQAYPDPDVIPPALIERVDVLPDGGSATYGSDAVGGVINFITKKDFDGVEIGVSQNLGDDYSGTDVNFTAGKAWSTGSAYIGYNFSIHDAVPASDRGYIKQIDYTTGLPTGVSCAPGNAIVNGSTYAVNGGSSLALSNANLCDYSKEKALYPEENRNSVMVGFRQELTDTIEFSLKGFYSSRNTLNENGPIQGTSQVAPGNPNYISTGDANGAATQAVDFNFAPVKGYENAKTQLWSLGITPTLTWNFANDWEAVAFYNYGQSQTKANDPQFNSTLLGADVAAGTINPYNIAASNAGALSDVLDFTNNGIGKDKLSNAKLTVDGPLFSLPGGELRVAVGAEYISEKFQGNSLTGITYEAIPAAPLTSAQREVEAGFGEVNIPVIGPDNNVPLVNSLTIAASERYDHYSDFGGNWAPNLGVTLKPVDWVGLRARWNKSFQAPSLVQLAAASSPAAGVFPASVVSFAPGLLNPAVPYNNGPIVAVQGTVSPLQPQKARDYNLGFDVSPPIIDGLNLHFTYYNITYSGSINGPPLGSGPFYNVASYNSLYTMLPTIAQVTSTLAAAGVPAAQIANTIAQINAQGGHPYVVADIRQRNLGITKTNGFDFSFDYTHDVSFGTAYASFSGTYDNRSITAADAVTFAQDQSDIDGNSPFIFSSTVGATVGDDIRTQVTWKHRSGFGLVVDPGQLGQTRVGAFDTFDLYTEYDLKRSYLPPLSFSLGITNLFGTNPPLYRNSSPQEVGGGYWNGATLGRVFQLGVDAKF